MLPFIRPIVAHEHMCVTPSHILLKYWGRFPLEERHYLIFLVDLVTRESFAIQHANTFRIRWKERSGSVLKEMNCLNTRFPGLLCLLLCAAYGVKLKLSLNLSYIFVSQLNLSKNSRSCSSTFVKNFFVISEKFVNLEIKM